MRLILTILSAASCVCMAEDAFVSGAFAFTPKKDKPSAVFLEKPVLQVAAAPAEAPKIDGVLDDACWAKARAVALTNPTRPTAEPAVALLSFGADALHVGCLAPLPKNKFEGKTPEQAEALMAELSASRKQDLNVWCDESFEIFVDPGRSTQRYFQFIVNTLNTHQESEGFTSSWDGAWQSAVVIAPLKGEMALPAAIRDRADLGPVVKRTAFYWIAEIAIPYASLQAQAPKAGEKWGINLVHSDKLSGIGSNWARCRMNNHEPTSFGEVRFVEKLPETYFSAFWTASKPALGENTLSYCLCGPAKNTKLTLVHNNPEGERTQLQPLSVQSTSVLTTVLSQAGRHELQLAIEDRDGGGAMDQARFVYEVEPPVKPLALKLDQPEYYLSEEVARARVTLAALADKATQEVEFRIANEKGDAVRQGKGTAAARGTEFELGISGLPAGAYTLEAKAGENSAKRTFRISAGPFDTVTAP